MRILLFWLLLVSLVWAQDEPVFLLSVPLVARDAAWSAALPGEPELRIKGKSRNWSYLDQIHNCLYMVVEAGGWPAAEDQAGWEKTAGAVAGSLSDGKPVEITVQALHGRPGCLLRSGEVQAQALRLEDGRHLMLAAVPLTAATPPSKEFFAALEVPARFTGQLVSPSGGNWSLVFAAAPTGPPDDLQLQTGATTYRARQLTRTGNRDQQLAALLAEVSAQGQLVGQRSYTVEGLPMQQYTVRAADSATVHHRILWLKPDQLLWLTAGGVDSATAQRFFTSFRRWN